MRDWEGKLEAALRSLAESARDQTVAPSGAEIRRRAEMRRRKRAFLLPSVLLSCTLAGGTAYGLTAALGHSSSNQGSARPGPTASQTVAPGYAGPATLAPGPDSSHSGPRPSGSQAAGAGPQGPGTPRLLQPLCELSKSYPYMAYVQGLSPTGVLNVIPAACTPDPQDPSTGKLVPSGPVRHLAMAPGVTVLATAPIGPGSQPSSISLTQLGLGLQQHPGSLFGITFGSGGQVTRIAEIYVRGAGGPSPSSGPPSLGSGF